MTAVRIEAMRVLPSHVECPCMDPEVVGVPDPLIVGPASQVYEMGEDPGRLLPRL